MKRNRLMAFALAITMALSLCACWADTDLQSNDPTSATRPAVTNPNALHYGLYVQDGKLFYVNFVDEISILQIGDELLKGDIVRWTWSEYTSRIYLSADGKYMVYPQGDGTDPSTHTDYVPDYYYIDLTNPDQEPIFVGTGIIRGINQDFNIFTQIQIPGNQMYQYDLNGDTQIATDVVFSYGLNISDDGKCIYYISYEDYALYRWTAEEGSTQIATDVTWCETAEDFATIFYIREDTLYVQKQGQQAQMLGSLASDNAIQVYQDGTAHFYTTDDRGDYSDVGFEFLWGDSIKTLHYYDGQKTHIVSDAVTRKDLSLIDDTAVIFYKTATGSQIAIKDTIIPLPDGYSVFSCDGKYAFVGVRNDATQKASIYRLTIQGTEIVEEELLIEELSSNYTMEILGSSLIALQDIAVEDLQYNEKYNIHYSTEAGSLYLNTQYIDDNVKRYTVIGDEQNRNGILYYLKDWDPETFYGTLRVYDGEKAETVMDNVYEMVLTPGGELMFLRNYDLTTYTGELWVYRDGACCKLADNVSQILTATDLS